MSPEHDVTGQETLERFANAPAFNRWLYQSIAPYCKGSILEIGSGIGNISTLLLEDHAQVTLSDLRQPYCEKLRQRFGNHPHFKGALQLDIAPDNFDQHHPQLLQQFDTVIALNVVEHIQDDARALDNCKKLLRSNGRLIILVPAYQSLYNSFDLELGHFKRYTRKELAEKMQSAGMDLVHSQYFNLAGVPGWWLTGSVMKKKVIPGAQLKIFNRLVPVFRVLDKIILKKAGLSAIAVAVKHSK
ncbi:MAG: class I SAM-dependent methyltransferase [Chitinophagaceae bacterium]|nr:MAG: class I SAM-dependent methyltransferase [Chitinophagaceae bacterium]